MSILYFTGKSVACGEKADHGYLTLSNCHHKGSIVSDKNSVQEIEIFIPPLRWSRGVWSTLLRFPKTVMVAIENPLTYEGVVRGSKKKEWTLALKEQSDSIDWNITWILIVLPPSKDAIPCKVVMKQKLNEQGRTTSYNVHLVT